MSILDNYQNAYFSDDPDFQLFISSHPRVLKIHRLWFIANLIALGFVIWGTLLIQGTATISNTIPLILAGATLFSLATTMFLVRYPDYSYNKHKTKTLSPKTEKQVTEKSPSANPIKDITFLFNYKEPHKWTGRITDVSLADKRKHLPFDKTLVLEAYDMEELGKKSNQLVLKLFGEESVVIYHYTASGRKQASLEEESLIVASYTDSI